MKDQALWTRIESHDLPDGFEAELAARTGWSRDRAARAVLEYKRLAYLTALVKSVRRVPSKPVEQVWDLHRDHAEDYARFTSEVMGRTWSPPRGGFSRRDGRDWDATAKAYRREFAEDPPARLWPDPNRGVRLVMAGGFAAAGVAGSVAAASIGPAVAGVALALLILAVRARGGGGSADDSAFWGLMAAGDGGTEGAGDGGDGGGGCD